MNGWFSTSSSQVAHHVLHALQEIASVRSDAIVAFREVIKSHYVAPEIALQRLADLGAPSTAALLREQLPTTKRSRSGDFGEILATELTEHLLHYRVPIRRLRWKEGRDLAQRGDDLLGVRAEQNSRTAFLKGEAKSRVALSAATVQEADTALAANHARPNRHSVLFIAERVREMGDQDLALRLEQAVLRSFSGDTVEQLLFAVSQNDPSQVLTSNLEACRSQSTKRYAVGVRVTGHAALVAELFEGI